MSYDPCNPDIAGAIAKQGFYICNFEMDGYLPSFSYTVGLTESWGHPEILIMGLALETNSSCLVDCAERVRDGEVLKPASDYDGILKCPVRFVEVLPQHLGNHFGFGLEYYRDKGAKPFKALQFVWPDKELKWPWDDEFDANLKSYHKLLDRDPEFAFYEPKNLGTFVTKGVLDGKTIIDVHHEEDGSWQFLADEPRTTEYIALVCLEEVVKIDPTVNNLFHLGFGQSASRKTKRSEWEISAAE